MRHPVLTFAKLAMLVIVQCNFIKGIQARDKKSFLKVLKIGKKNILPFVVRRERHMVLRVPIAGKGHNFKLISQLIDE